MYEPDYLKALQFIVSVHNQLCSVAINSHKDHILWAVLHIAANQLVGGSISEELQNKKQSCNLTLRHTALTQTKSRLNMFFIGCWLHVCRILSSIQHKGIR